MAAHPRSRGENRSRAPSGPSRTGSSPLTRGKLDVVPEIAAVVRLIPAHAGKTAGLRGVRFRRPAHPRSRGENQAFDPTANGEDGSSPLTRGKPDRCDHRPRHRGLIPAHAGKTSLVIALSGCRRAHPRSRGENRSCAPSPPTASGSSPLTRGKRRGGAPPGCPPRLIPAHAGKTLPEAWLGGQAAAHPRSRGENSTSSLRLVPWWGSSPLTRGKPRQSRLVADREVAHPRSRGENQANDAGVCHDSGSSPLTRGKHH